MQTITGFVVVNRERPINGLYRGIDRSPWDSVSEAYYASILPPDLRSEFELMNGRVPNCLYGFVSKVEIAMKLLAVTQSNEKEEIIAIDCEMLSRNSQLPDKCEFLGYDVVDLDSFSLIKAALASESLHQLIPQLNTNGLFAVADQARAHLVSYESDLVPTGAEPLPFGSRRVAVCGVWLVLDRSK